MDENRTTTLLEERTSQDTTPSDALRLGILYCPRPGGKRLWKKIRRCLKDTGVEFDYFKSENSADVERLATIMTKNGYTTIIVVGGDSALNYAINAIMRTTSPTGKRPTLGVIPAGYGNDFAKYWGLEPSDYRRTIKGLMMRRTRRIDVGRCTVEIDGHTRTDYFLNCVNIGVAASIMNIRHLTFSIFGLRTISYLFSAFILLFSKLNYKLSFTTSGETFERRAMTLCIGSARGYGQTPSAVPYNGLLDISLVTTPQLTQLLHGLFLLFTGRFLGHKGISVWRTREVNFHQLGNTPVSLDGRFIYAKADNLKADILPEAIDFLIVS